MDQGVLSPGNWQTTKRCSILPVIREMGIEIHDHHSPDDANHSHGRDETAQRKAQDEGEKTTEQ